VVQSTMAGTPTEDRQGHADQVFPSYPLAVPQDYCFIIMVWNKHPLTTEVRNQPWSAQFRDTLPTSVRWFGLIPRSPECGQRERCTSARPGIIGSWSWWAGEQCGTRGRGSVGGTDLKDQGPKGPWSNRPWQAHATPDRQAQRDHVRIPYVLTVLVPVGRIRPMTFFLVRPTRTVQAVRPDSAYERRPTGLTPTVVLTTRVQLGLPTTPAPDLGAPLPLVILRNPLFHVPSSLCGGCFPLTL